MAGLSTTPELTFESIMEGYFETYAKPSMPDVTYQDFAIQHGLLEPDLSEEPIVWDADAEMQLLIAGEIPAYNETEDTSTSAATEPVVRLASPEPTAVTAPAGETGRRWRRVRRVGMLAGAMALTVTIGATTGLVATSALYSRGHHSPETVAVAGPVAEVVSEPTTEPAPVSITTTEAVPTTEASAPPFRPAAGEQSAVLRFAGGMCNEEISVREAPAEYGVNADESILNTLELDPTPQVGCEAGTNHVEAARANGGKNRTREDGGRFVIEDWNALPTLPDGSRPTNPGQLQPIAERSMASNMFGESGVVYVDGHRSTESAPFALLDNNAPGDKIVAARGDGKNFDYTVNRVASIPVGTYQQDLLTIIDQIRVQAGHENVLVISACDPYGSKTHRVVLFATLDDR